MSRRMKDSGIEWIGEIPEDWELTKVKHIGKYINGYPFKPSDWSDFGTPIIRIQNLTGNNSEYNYYGGPKLPDDYLILNNDYLISWSATLGVYIWHKEKGYLNQHIFKAIPNEDVVNYDYFYWIANIFIDEIQSHMHGSAMQHVTKSVFDNFTIPLPKNIEEQIRISKLLESKITLKNGIKEDIIKEIKTLENYKKSLITEAVTKGLDKNVEMKDSEIEWIGEIPEHWDLVKLKNLVKYNYKSLDDSTKKDFIFKYIDISSVEYGKGILSLELMTFEKAPSRARRIVQAGDIIISTVRTYLKSIAIVPESDIPLVASTGFIVIRTKGDVEQSFLNYAVQAENFISKIVSNSTGVSYPAINASDLVNIKIVVPDKANRIKIVEYLDNKCQLIDDSISIKKQQLEILEEYKKSLIYEYVTGKKEVKDV